MCGLVGIAGKLVFQDEFTMKRMLLADYFRGPDSTGMAAIRTDGSAIISKVASNPIDLFGMASFTKALNGNASRAFIGHNRLATKGGISTVNAHPYHIEHIVGAHNGTLDKESIKALEDKLGESYAVDSMLLFACIAKFGIKKTIELCYEGKSQQEGAWALVWFDQKEGTLNFLRNKWRPLYYAYEAPPEKKETDKEDPIGFQRMFWASEWWMMREAIVSSEKGYTVYTKPGTTTGFFPFEVDVHYKFDLAAVVEGTKKLPKPKLKKIKGKERETKAVVPFTSHYHPPSKEEWPRATSGISTGGCGKAKSIDSSKMKRPTGSSKRQIIQLTGDALHPYANIIDSEKFVLSYAFNGCAWCQRDIWFGELGVTFIERDAKMLCRSCTGYSDSHENPSVRIYVHGSVIDSLS